MMGYRFMRIIILFDLPTLTDHERGEYRRFRKYLLKSGFIMMQESVYTKIALNSTATQAIKNNIRKNKPDKGLVQMMTITEKQFNKMEFVVGDRKTEVLNTDERLVIL